MSEPLDRDRIVSILHKLDSASLTRVFNLLPGANEHDVPNQSDPHRVQSLLKYVEGAVGPGISELGRVIELATSKKYSPRIDPPSPKTPSNSLSEIPEQVEPSPPYLPPTRSSSIPKYLLAIILVAMLTACVLIIALSRRCSEIEKENHESAIAIKGLTEKEKNATMLAESERMEKKVLEKKISQLEQELNKARDDAKIANRDLANIKLTLPSQGAP